MIGQDQTRNYLAILEIVQMIDLQLPPEGVPYRIYRRRTDGVLLDTLGQVVIAILDDDLIVDREGSGHE